MALCSDRRCGCWVVADNSDAVGIRMDVTGIGTSGDPLVLALAADFALLLSSTIDGTSVVVNAATNKIKTNPPKIDTFVASGKWTKPDGVTSVEVVTIGGGGGGSAGWRGGTITNQRLNGSGGGGGGRVVDFFDADLLGLTEDVVVGAGGIGGAAALVDNTAGDPGAAGLASTFGSWVYGGGGQGGGVSGNYNAPVARDGNGMSQQGGQGGTITAVGGTNILNSGGGGGGCGGRVNSGNAYVASTAGGARAQSNSGGGTAGANGGTVGGAGTASTTNLAIGGGGGGGGGANTAGAGGGGGSGAIYGGGGGGGGGGANGYTGGVGGNGGNGIVIVISYF